MSKNKSGALGVVFVLFVCGGMAGLYYAGKLQPLIDKIHETVKSSPEIVEKSVKYGEPPKPAVQEEAEPSEPEPAPEEPAESEAEATYRARFKAPETGSTIGLVLKNKKKITGTLTGLDDNSVSIKTKKMELTLTRGQLSEISLARCYEDYYIKYMIARQKYIEEAEKKRAKQLAKMKADYLAFLEKGKGTTSASSSGGSTKTTSSASINDIDFKKWMEENGASDLLKARQERIKQYEAERIAAGRQY